MISKDWLDGEKAGAMDSFIAKFYIIDECANGKLHGLEEVL